MKYVIQEDTLRNVINEVDNAVCEIERDLDDIMDDLVDARNKEIGSIDDIGDIKDDINNAINAISRVRNDLL